MKCKHDFDIFRRAILQVTVICVRPLSSHIISYFSQNLKLPDQIMQCDNLKSSGSRSEGEIRPARGLWMW